MNNAGFGGNCQRVVLQGFNEEGEGESVKGLRRMSGWLKDRGVNRLTVSVSTNSERRPRIKKKRLGDLDKHRLNEACMRWNLLEPQHIVQLAPPDPPPAFVGIANSESSHDSVAGVGAAGATVATRAERMFEKESIDVGDLKI